MIPPSYDLSYEGQSVTKSYTEVLLPLPPPMVFPERYFVYLGSHLIQLGSFPVWPSRCGILLLTLRDFINFFKVQLSTTQPLYATEGKGIDKNLRKENCLTFNNPYILQKASALTKLSKITQKNNSYLIILQVCKTKRDEYDNKQGCNTG